ncbi:hypothetical protein F2P56_022584, partial [Juglans regia]
GYLHAKGNSSVSSFYPQRFQTLSSNYESLLAVNSRFCLHISRIFGLSIASTSILRLPTSIITVNVPTNKKKKVFCCGCSDPLVLPLLFIDNEFLCLCWVHFLLIRIDSLHEIAFWVFKILLSYCINYL